ncbi:MAG: class I SAM-dependent methyltransferase [Streptococcaceae bacterium]|jgi:SAM-dependent methyltransferase|nr:class I SAM-dependent methyltransferase [Streptococcaceae bacterium]
MFEKLVNQAYKPQVNEPGSDNLWTDEHISKGMLAVHLQANEDGASRKHDFIAKSADWIKEVAPPKEYKKLLDLGCGPGLYAQHFAEFGFEVTGIDFSKRSIDYAKAQSRQIDYHCKNYLTLDYQAEFDVVTLIYTDYCVLSSEDRRILMNIVFRALKPGGKFIFDVSMQQKERKEMTEWQMYEKGGFFADEPHLYLNAIYQYGEFGQTQLSQHIVITKEQTKSYHVWHHYFTKEEILAEVSDFSSVQFFDDVAGSPYSSESETLCLVVTK